MRRQKTERCKKLQGNSCTGRRNCQIRIFLVALFVLLTGTVAPAGIITKADFPLSASIETFETLTIAVDETSPLVLNGVTYETTAGQFRVTNGSGFGLDAESVFALAASHTTDIFFVGVNQVGLDLANIVSLSTQVQFFDETSQLLLSTVVVNPSNGEIFIGFRNDGGLVSQIRLIDNNAADGASIVFDNVHSAIPEPSALAIGLVGLLSLSYHGKRRR